MYGCESWSIKKDGCRRIDAFKLWCWRRLLRVPWTARRLHQSIRKEINPEYSLEGPMLKLKLQYSGYLMQTATHWKRSYAGQDWRQEEKGMTEDEMVGWHHWLNGHEVKWSEIVQSCPTLCNPMDCSLPGSSVHRIFQARVLEWIAISFARGSSRPRNWTRVSHIAGRRLSSEPPGKPWIWANSWR